MAASSMFFGSTAHHTSMCTGPERASPPLSNHTKKIGILFRILINLLRKQGMILQQVVFEKNIVQTDGGREMGTFES